MGYSTGCDTGGRMGRDASNGQSHRGPSIFPNPNTNANPTQTLPQTLPLTKIGVSCRPSRGMSDIPWDGP